LVSCAERLPPYAPVLVAVMAPEVAKTLYVAAVSTKEPNVGFSAYRTAGTGQRQRQQVDHIPFGAGAVPVMSLW